MPWIGSQCRAGLRHPQRASGPPLLAGPVTTKGPLSVDPEPGRRGLGIPSGPRLPPGAPSRGDAPPQGPVSIPTAPVELCLHSLPACFSGPACDIFISRLALCVSLPPLLFANSLSEIRPFRPVQPRSSAHLCSSLFHSRSVRPSLCSTRCL